MKILCPEQYDPLWWELRRGRPTSSNAAKICTPAKMDYSTQSKAYINTLIGELYDAEYPREDGYKNAAMQRGTELEAEARESFGFDKSFTIEEVGLCSDDEETLWGSPDGIIVETGEPVEIKAPNPATHVAYILGGKLPSAYIGQVHAHMLVAGVKSAWLSSYCPGFSNFMVHVKAGKYLNELRACMTRFHDDYQSTLDQIIKHQGPPPERVIPEPITEVETF